MMVAVRREDIVTMYRRHRSRLQHEKDKTTGVKRLTENVPTITLRKRERPRRNGEFGIKFKYSRQQGNGTRW